jgi:hypothetical protein
MRHYLFCIIFVLSLSSEGKAQQPSFPRFLKTVERYFDRDVFPEDSCFSNATMLRVELNDDYKVQSILLADNAETWQKRSLEKIKYRLPIVEIEAYAKIHEIKNAAFHFPFLIKKNGPSCIGDTIAIPFTPRLFSFNGKDSRGFLMDKIEVIFVN